MSGAINRNYFTANSLDPFNSPSSIDQPLISSTDLDNDSTILGSANLNFLNRKNRVVDLSKVYYGITISNSFLSNAEFNAINGNIAGNVAYFDTAKDSQAVYVKIPFIHFMPDPLEAGDNQHLKNSIAESYTLCFPDPTLMNQSVEIPENTIVKVMFTDQNLSHGIIVSDPFLQEEGFLTKLSNFLNPQPAPPIPTAPGQSPSSPPPSPGTSGQIPSYPPGNNYLPSSWRSPGQLRNQCGSAFKGKYKLPPPQPRKEYRSFSEIPKEFIQAQASTFKAQADQQKNLLVLHSTEGSRNNGAVGTGRYFALPTAKGAAHYTVDDKKIVQSVREEFKAHHANGRNDNSIGIEHCGSAEFCKEEWLDDYSINQLHMSAWLAADICYRWKIPPIYLTPEEVNNRKPGICAHNDVTVGTGRGSHWDPGPNFPYEHYINMVRQFLKTYGQ